MSIRSSARVLQRTIPHLSEAHELVVCPTFLRVVQILPNPNETHTFMGPLDKCGLSRGKIFYCVDFFCKPYACWWPSKNRTLAFSHYSISLGSPVYYLWNRSLWFCGAHEEAKPPEGIISGQYNTELFSSKLAKSLFRLPSPTGIDTPEVIEAHISSLLYVLSSSAFIPEFSSPVISLLRVGHGGHRSKRFGVHRSKVRSLYKISRN